MLSIRRVLCPVDLSDCSQHALDHAAAIARWYESAVTVLHVFTTPVAAVPVPGWAGPVPAALDREHVLAQLSAVVSAAGRPGVSTALMSRDGDAVREILAAATELPADLLVIGTHGRSGFERLVLGSVAEKVLRRAACPVLSVPPRAAGAGPSTSIVFKRILCPIDFSGPSEQALRYATSLAQEADAHLTVMHVIEHDVYELADLYEGFMSNERLSIADYRTRVREVCRERLELATSDDVRQYCTVEAALTDGKPYKEILRLAGAQGSDVIVMGVRGRSPADLAFFGSTTQHVVRQAACPVLTIRGV
jgi:nucleotide-binding universal stress UspA family protein